MFGFAKRSLRSHPRINPSTQPSDVARGSRSKAAAELALILLSGEKHKRCAFCPIVGGWLASDGGLTADQSPTECTQTNCGSWLASDGGRPADQSLTECTRSNCGSEPARESGLPNTITFRPATKNPEAFAVRALKIKRSQPSAAPTQSLFRSCGRLRFFYFVMGSLPVHCFSEIFADREGIIASRLTPTRDCRWTQICDPTTFQSGSEPARESGLPSTITFRPATKTPEAFAVRALKIKRSQPSAAPALECMFL